VLDALSQLARCDLPIGCLDAIRELQQVLPFFAPRLTACLSIDQLCKIIVELGRYCAYRNVVEEEFSREQGRAHRTRA